VTVSAVRPGQIRTPIFNKAGDALSARLEAVPADLRSGYEKMYARGLFFSERGVNSPTPPEAVAKAILHALSARLPRPYYMVGFDARALKLVRSWIPARLRDRVIARLMGTFKRLH